jgi:hypothetical protein
LPLLAVSSISRGLLLERFRPALLITHNMLHVMLLVLRQ